MYVSKYMYEFMYVYMYDSELCIILSVAVTNRDQLYVQYRFARFRRRRRYCARHPCGGARPRIGKVALHPCRPHGAGRCHTAGSHSFC